MTRTSRSEPRTPYEVRIITWLRIRQRIPRDFHQTIEQWKATDAAFGEAYAELERLDSVATKDMPPHEKLQAMMHQARRLMLRAKVLAEQREEA